MADTSEELLKRLRYRAAWLTSYQNDTQSAELIIAAAERIEDLERTVSTLQALVREALEEDIATYLIVA